MRKIIEFESRLGKRIALYNSLNISDEDVVDYIDKFGEMYCKDIIFMSKEQYSRIILC